jgi:membrane protease YdiL (CAAX protease family)
LADSHHSPVTQAVGRQQFFVQRKNVERKPMTTIRTAYISEPAKSHRYISFWVVIGLLLLRIPFRAGFVFLYETPPEWVQPTFEIMTYLLTAFLIWWEREKLSFFHIDTMAVVIIILFKPLETLILAVWSFDSNPLAFPKPLSLVVWIIALGLAIALKLSQVKLPKIQIVSFKFFAVGTLIGIAYAILFAYPMSLQINQSTLKTGPEFLPILGIFLMSFAYQIGYAAVTEEPLFRGFLWGHLRGFGWKEGRIWIFQAGLFSLAHIYYVNRDPISFWFIVPMGALVLGLLAWRTRSITTSMAAHGASNALTRFFGNIVAFYRI